MPHPSPMAGVRKVAFIAHSAHSLLRFRGNLMREIARRRHRVLALAPDLGTEAKAALAADGIDAQAFLLEPAGAGPFAERRTERALGEPLNAFAPHIVVASGPRTAALGARIGKAAGASMVAVIVNGLASLGYGSVETRGWLRESGIKRQRRAMLAAADLVVFHNPDDARQLIGDDVMPAAKRHIVTPGSGIDLTHFAAMPLPPLGDGLVFLKLARLDAAHGVPTYLEAASLVKAKSAGARFLIAGAEAARTGEGAPISLQRMKDTVEYLGFAEDVRPLLARAHVLVHAGTSEGLSGALLEALAAGRPVIAADIAGSRPTVDERVNGVLVPPGDAAALAAAMETFLKRPDLIPAMARAARAKAERLFDERAVIAEMIGALDLG